MGLVMVAGDVYKSSTVMYAGVVLLLVWSVAATIGIHRNKWRKSKKPSIIANILMFPLILWMVVHFNMEFGLMVKKATVEVSFSR